MVLRDFDFIKACVHLKNFKEELEKKDLDNVFDIENNYFQLYQINSLINSFEFLSNYLSNNKKYISIDESVPFLELKLLDLQ